MSTVALILWILSQPAALQVPWILEYHCDSGWGEQTDFATPVNLQRDPVPRRRVNASCHYPIIIIHRLPPRRSVTHV